MLKIEKVDEAITYCNDTVTVITSIKDDNQTEIDTRRFEFIKKKYFTADTEPIDILIYFNNIGSKLHTLKRNIDNSPESQDKKFSNRDSAWFKSTYDMLLDIARFII